MVYKLVISSLPPLVSPHISSQASLTSYFLLTTGMFYYYMDIGLAMKARRRTETLILTTTYILLLTAVHY